MTQFTQSLNSLGIPKVLFFIGVFILASLTSACQPAPKTEPVSKPKPAPTKKFTRCKDPRPEMCTREYRPVCASVDTGIRCVTTPCPSTKDATYSNACTACSDTKVHGYIAGACE